MTLPVWDRNDALSLTLNSTEVLASVIQSYVEDTVDLMDQLATAMRAENLDQSRFIAHSLKGTASNVAASRFSEHAKRLEQSAKSNDLALAKQAHQSLISEFVQLRQALAQFLSEQGIV